MDPSSTYCALSVLDVENHPKCSVLPTNLLIFLQSTPLSGSLLATVPLVRSWSVLLAKGEQWQRKRSIISTCYSHVTHLSGSALQIQNRCIPSVECPVNIATILLNPGLYSPISFLSLSSCGPPIGSSSSGPPLTVAKL